MNSDFLRTVGRELSRLGTEAGASEACDQDGFEAFARAGLVDLLTPAGVAGLSGGQRERLRDALIEVFEVPVEQAAVDDALALISWHWSRVPDQDA